MPFLRRSSGQLVKHVSGTHGNRWSGDRLVVIAILHTRRTAVLETFDLLTLALQTVTLLHANILSPPLQSLQVALVAREQ